MSDQIQAVDEIAREAWWPHHASRTRRIALAALDAGAPDNVSLTFEDVRGIVEYALAARVVERDAKPGDGDTPWDRAYNAGFRQGYNVAPAAAQSEASK